MAQWRGGTTARHADKTKTKAGASLPVAAVSVAVSVSMALAPSGLAEAAQASVQDAASEQQLAAASEGLVAEPHDTGEGAPEEQLSFDGSEGSGHAADAPDPADESSDSLFGEDASAQSAPIEDGSQETSDVPTGTGAAGEASPETPSAAAVQLLDEGTSLNELWEGVDGGTGSPLTITEGGTYRLSGDLTTTQVLTIDAAGQDVTLDLGSFVFTSSCASSDGAIVVSSAASCTIVGSLAATGKAQLVQTGASPTSVIASAADAIALRDVGIYQRSAEDAISLSSLGLSGLYASAGSVSMEACSVEIDLSNQSGTNIDSGGGLKGSPRGIYLGARVKAATIADCTVTVSGSPAAELAEGEQWSTTCCANAYGLYSLATKEVLVSGGSFTASSPNGFATGIYGKKLRLVLSAAGGVAVQASAGKVAAGLRGPSKGSVTLAAPLSSQVSSEAGVACSLLAMEEDAFIFAQGFSGAGLGVVVGDPLGSPNAEGARLGSFDASVDGVSREAIAASLVNGLAAGACRIVLGDGGDALVFVLDAAKAPAQVISPSGEVRAVASVAEAVSQVEVGGTVRLLADAGSISFDRSALEGDSFTLDLAGHTTGAITVSSASSVSIVSSEGRGLIRVSGSSSTGILHAGSGSLSASGLAIHVMSLVKASCGIEVTGRGSLALFDVSLRVCGSYESLSGIRSNGNVSIEGGSISVDSSSLGVPVRGVHASSSSALVAVSNCALSLAGTNSVVGALDIAGSLEYAAGTTGSIALSASTATADVFGVLMRSAGQTATVDGFRLSVDAPSADSLFYALASGEKGASAAVSWTLSGSFALSGSSQLALGLREQPCTLAEGFSLSGMQLLVDAKQLNDKVCFTAPSGAQRYAGAFAAAPGSAYEGWSLAAQADAPEHLAFMHAPVAQNLRSKESYPSLFEAIEAASDGDTLCLTDDCSVTEALSLQKSLSIDLSGHELSWTVDTADLVKANDALAALLLEGASSLTLADSVGNGHAQLVVENGSGSLASDSLCGLAVGQGASLFLDGAALSVEYRAFGNAASDANFAAVRCAGGSASIDAKATLDVSAQVEGSATGPAELIGIDAATSGASVKVERGGAVSASNHGALTQKGNLVSLTMGTSVRVRQLMEFFPEKDGALYAEIQKRFFEQAKLDAETEMASFSYGTNVYYAAPLELSDGTLVWAYSDPVSSADIGKRESVVATHFYCQSYLDETPDAYGIRLGASGAKATIEGSVFAASDEGNATAVKVESGAFAQVGNGASLSASAGEQAYRKQGEDFDLRSELGLSAERFTSSVFYPSTSTGFHVDYAYPSAVGIDGQSSDFSQAAGATVSLSQTAGAPEAPKSPTDAGADEVSITVTNVRYEQGSARADAELSLPFGSTIAEAGLQLPETRDYVSATGVSYRFVGWKLDMTYSLNAVWSAEDFASSCVFDEYVSGASSGAVSVSAVYVPVDAGQALVTFKIDGFVKAYAVDAGEVPRYQDASAGSRFSTPGKLGSGSEASYGFSAWVGNGQRYVGTLPAATSDIVYTAEFASVPNQASITLVHWAQADGEARFTQTIAMVDYGSVPFGGLDVPSSVAKGGVVYELLGFSTRRTDKEAVYASLAELPAVNGSATYYGIYESHGQVVSITFYLDGEPYATALDVPGGTTIDVALLSYAEKPRPTDKATGRFKGWALEDGAEKALMGSVKTVGELAAGEDGIVRLYAVFGKNESTLPEDDDSPDEVIVKPNTGLRGNTLSNTGARRSTGGIGRAGNAGNTAAPAASSAFSRTTSARNASAANETPEASASAAGGTLASDAPLVQLADAATPDDLVEGIGSAPAQESSTGFFAFLAALVIGGGLALKSFLGNRRLDAASVDPDSLPDDFESMDF